MFGNLGVHIIKYPTGRYGYVGTLPAILGDAVRATSADIMGGRAETSPIDGQAYTLKFPSFETAAAARAYAADRGITAKGDH
jgi:hypothetical protein